jgi:hypothetical protein
MAVELETILDGTRSATVELAAGTFTVKYKVDTFTADKEGRYGERVVAVGAYPAYVERFVETVIDWDVTYKGKKVALTSESISKAVPWPILSAAWNAVTVDRMKLGEAMPRSPES